jgi:plastocyanin
MRTALAVLIISASLLVATSAFGGSSVAKTLKGTVGPGFTISLKKGTKKVTSLKHGKYTFKISDKSAAHNFHLSGPGVHKDLTSVAFVGTKTVKLTLKKGTYRYWCVPHKPQMHGSFKVK